MIKFEVGKYYSLNYEKALESYDLRQWNGFINVLIPFKRGPRKCIRAVRLHEPVGDEENHQFCYHLSFEGGVDNGRWCYTESLLSCFKETERFVQEEMDI